MATFDYNPLTGELDLVGSGASYIDDVVADSSLLPITVGTPALDAVYLAKAGSGVWLINRKPAGLYVRVANNGVAADWQYLGAFPEVNADGNWELYNSADPTKELKFDLSGISTGTTRTLTPPNANATIAAARVSRLQQFFSSQTFNVAQGLNVEIELQNSVPSCAIVIVLPRLTTDGARNGDEILLRPTSLGSGSSYTLQRYIWTGSSYIGSTETITTMEFGQTYHLRLVEGRWTLLVTPNLASPPAIGSTTRNTGAFTTLNANNGTLTASAPVLDLSQTWNNAAVAFTGIRLNVTNTASANTSDLLTLQIGGTTQFRIRNNQLFLGEFTLSGLYTPAPSYIGSTGSLMCATQLAIGNNLDTILIRDGASGALAQRNGTNPQTFRLYNTFTDASNHERGFMRWSSNVLQIGTEKAGTGSARALQFQTDGTTRVTVDATGQVGIGVAPERPFHIQGSAAFIRVDRQGSFGPALLFTRMATGTTVTSSWLFGPTDQVAGVSNDDFAIIDFGTSVGGTSGTQRLTISKSTGQLTVNGNLNLATKDLVTDTTTGTKIGTGTTQKLGFFNATPIVRPAAIADATDAATTQARLNELLAAMRSLGLIAT